MSSPIAVSRSLAGRSLMLVVRVPSTFVPSLIFPIFSVVAFSGAFSGLVRLPGFPVPKMIDWILPMAIVQGCAFAGVTTGLGTARDIESGFFDRLRLAPTNQAALVTGPMAASVARSVIPYALVLPVGLLAGARMRGGVAGAFMLLVASLGTAAAASGWALGLALRLKSTSRAGPLMQVGLFVVVFLSTAQVPLSVMTGWLKPVARINPMTEVFAMARQGFIGPVNWHDTWPGLLAILVASLLLGIFAVRGLRSFDR